MVTLYTWLPPSPEQLLRRHLLPDLGHSALSVQSEGSGSTCYVSFWPERESLVGEATRPWKPRGTRHPVSYAQESSREGGFMQRPADFADPLHGLDEERILEGWEELGDKHYVLETFNCSNVTHALLAAAMPPRLYALLREAGDALPEELGVLEHVTAVRFRLRRLLLHKFTSEQPLEVRRIALAYQRLASETQETNPQDRSGARPR
jgi:hypothetical protein